MFQCWISNLIIYLYKHSNYNLSTSNCQLKNCIKVLNNIFMLDFNWNNQWINGISEVSLVNNIFHSKKGSYWCTISSPFGSFRNVLRSIHRWNTQKVGRNFRIFILTGSKKISNSIVHNFTYIWIPKYLITDVATIV